MLYRALDEARRQHDAGERDADQSRAAMRSVLQGEPSACEDYVSAADPETLVELEKIRDRVLLSLGVKIGKTRLIDNLLL